MIELSGGTTFRCHSTIDPAADRLAPLGDGALSGLAQELTQNLTHFGRKSLISWLPLGPRIHNRRLPSVRTVVAPYSKCRDLGRVGSSPTTRTILLHEPKQPQNWDLDRFCWGEMHRTGIAPNSPEMTAERLSCWPSESRTGFGHRHQQTNENRIWETHAIHPKRYPVIAFASAP